MYSIRAFLAMRLLLVVVVSGMGDGVMGSVSTAVGW